MKVYGIMVVTKDNVIGIDGGLPCKCPEDLDNFRRLTMGHAVIVGRATLKTLPKLSGRRLFCLTTQPDVVGCYGDDNVLYVNRIDKATQIAGMLGYTKLFVAGGLGVYKQLYETDMSSVSMNTQYEGLYRTRLAADVLDKNQTWHTCTRVDKELEDKIRSLHNTPRTTHHLHDTQGESVGFVEYLAFGKP